jgi:hydroxymethylpyrimidine/phosphomethylpyrimidine kinase
MEAPPVILSIAGYDPSSGAGVTADIKTAAAHGCFAVTCITALTVQSSQGVFGVKALDPDVVSGTLKVLVADLNISAVRLGMLASGDVASAVAEFLERERLPNVVLDPVIRSSSGAALLDEAGLEVVRKRLIPACDVLTPNIHEAAVLTGGQPLPESSSWEGALPEIRQLAGLLHGMGAKGVVVTGGHLDPANDYVSYQSGSCGHGQACGCKG